MADFSASKDLYGAFLPEELANNILINPADAFASYTYRLTFSMLPYSFFSTGKVNLGTKDTNRIIISQTGVTKFQIDELEINSIVHPSPPPNLPGNRTSAYRLSFNLQEPFGMSFIDLLNRTAYEINKKDKIAFPNNTLPPLQTMPYVMEIELIGITEPDDPVDVGQDDNNVFYKTAIPFRVVNFDINPAVSGTTYAVQGVTINEISATADSSITIVPKDITITGSTVAELLDSLTKKMNEQQTAITGTAVVNQTDQQKFEKEQGRYVLGEEGFPKRPDIFAKGLPIDKEYSTAPIALKEVKNLKNKTTTTVAVQDISGEEDDATTAIGPVMTIKVPEGTEISKLMIQLGSLNSEYCNATHRYDVGEEAAEFPESAKPTDETQVVVPEVRRTWDWPTQKFTKTGKMALVHTFHLTGRLNSTSVMSPAELKLPNDETETTETRKAAVDRGVVKAYNYMYTGVNDQVLNVDMNINNGIRYLMPGYGGKQSNYSLSPAGAADKVAIEKIDQVEQEQTATVESEILAKFENIGKDIKDTLTKLATLPIELTADLVALATGLNPLGAGGLTTKNIRTLNPRLPSSPLAILQKTNTIGELTSSLDTLTSSITDLQSEIEGTISDFISGQISGIVSKAFTPFDILDSKLNKIANGINGYIDQIDSALGDIGLDQFGIDTTSLLDEARDKVDQLSNALPPSGTLPDGFTGGNTVNNITDSFDSLYAEEFEYNDSDEGPEYGQDIGGSIFGEYDKEAVKERDGVLPPSKFANRSLFSTMLSNSALGTPYMVRTTLEIKGDPFWFGKVSQTDDNFVFIRGKDFLGDQTNEVDKVRKVSADTNTAPYGIGEVCFFFAYLYPREYDTWSDDMSRNTGEMVDLSMNKSFSGQFTPYRVTHIFATGTFRQQLDAYRIIYKGQYPKKTKFGESVVKEQQDADERTAREAEARAKEKANKQNAEDFDLTPENIDQGNASGLGYNGPGRGGGGNTPQYDPGV